MYGVATTLSSSPKFLALPLAAALLAFGIPIANAQEPADSKPAAVQGSKPDPEFEASFSNGLRLHSDEDEWDIHLGGRYLGHERIVFDHSEESGFRTRQALVRLDAEAWKHLGLRIAGDFTPINGEPSARFHELYATWTLDTGFRITAGLAEMPTGLDKVMPLIYIKGVERPITSIFQSPEEPGVLVSGSLAEDVIRYDAAISDGRNEIVHPKNVDDSQLGLDSGTGHFGAKYYVSATVRPFAKDTEELLNNFRLGLFTAVNFTSGVDLFDAFRLRSQDFGITWLSPAAAEQDLFFQGRRAVVGVDPSWTAGPLLLEGEFLFRRDHVVRPSTGVETALDTLSWSAVTSWVLTGERQTLGSRILPQAPVTSIGGGTGLIDVHLRVADAHVDKSALDRLGTDFNRYTNRITSYGVGATWWPVSNVRISLELIREDYHQTIAVNSAGDRERALDGLLMRFQIDF